MPDPPAATDRRIHLKDGRSLGYAEHGVPAGTPVLVFPGMPGSRLLCLPAEPARALGARVLIIERPGFGLSDPLPGRTLLDWPDDVEGFADALGLDRFPVVGLSAGAPYALACAYKIPHCLTSTAIVSGLGPVDLPGAIEEMPRVRRAGAAIARRAPWLLGLVFWFVADPHRDLERFVRRMTSQASAPDRAVLARPGVREMMERSYLEATRAGVRGFAQEAILLSNSWGFRPEEISAPVYLWHGLEDASVSLSAARYVARALPNCQATFLPGEGHWLLLDRWGEILAALLAGQADAQSG